VITVKNRILKSVLLGTCTVVAASASYGLIPHKGFEDAKTLEQDRLISSKINQYTKYVEPPEAQHLNITEELEHTVKSGENLSSIFFRTQFKPGRFA